MKRRNFWLSLLPILGLAVICLILFIISGQSRYYQQEQTTASEPVLSAPAEIETSEVIVALQPIPRGSKFVAGSIGRRAWPRGNEPPDAIADESETIGKVAKNEIIQGQVILRSLLTDKDDAGVAAFSLPDDIPTSDATSINYVSQVKQPRVIIYTGQIWLVVEDTQAAVSAITQLAEAKGGYVSETNTYQTSNNVLEGEITIRVPSEMYQETLVELRALALRVEREESRSQDVTEEFIDQEARLVNLQAGEEAMQRLLDTEQQVSNIGEVAEVQQKLAEIRSQIEQTEGRLRYLTDQATLSTIQVELIPEAAPPTPTPTPTPLPGWSPQNIAGEASQSLVFSLQRTVDLLIWGVIFGLPLLIVYLVPAAMIVWLLRWGWKKFRKGGLASATTVDE